MTIYKTKGKLRFLDLFCGAGGFSEGLKLAGFKPVLGIDSWQPAVITYSANQNTNAQKIDILSLSNSIKSIEQLPDTEFIVGSPPCISFSNSNKSGYADKSLGIRLTEAFFRIVAVKKHKRDSILKGWVMENVPKSAAHIPRIFTFLDLDLGGWAAKNGYSPSDIALQLDGKIHVVDSSKLGAPQRRKRLFIIDVGGSQIDFNKYIKPQVGGTLGQVLARLPKPQIRCKRGLVEDPNYPALKIKKSELTDHFYDSGILARYWNESKYLKVNHPYMGKMSFPERLDAPARTIIASPFPRSREAMIFKCESGRKGDGEYRSPTVREAATIMTFPIDYRFFGPEHLKWRLIGNAVCPKVSEAVGFAIKNSLAIKASEFSLKARRGDFSQFKNLNFVKPRDFSVIPTRKPSARFRRHTFKEGNMTIALANYDLTVKGAPVDEWCVFATYGISTGYVVERLNDDLKVLLLEKITDSTEHKASSSLAVQLVEELDSYIKTNVPTSSNLLQQKFEQAQDYVDVGNPVSVIEKLKAKIEQNANGAFIDVSDLHAIKKDQITLRQALSAYSLLRITDQIYQRN